MKHCLRFVIVVITSAVLLSAAQIAAGPNPPLGDNLNKIIARAQKDLVTVRGLGTTRNFIATGTKYDTLGHILTSSSVCDVSDFEIIAADGRIYKARKIGIDKPSGLCILQVDGMRLSGQNWIKSYDKPEGSWISVIGIKNGLFSGINFGLYRGQTDEGLLRLSIDVDPGSFGGMILDVDGNPIGILVARESHGHSKSAILKPRNETRNAASERPPGKDPDPLTIAYAMPIDVADHIAGQLILNGKVNRGFLGVGIRQLTDAEKLKHNIKDGVHVNDVLKESPAEKSGIVSGDIIVAIDGIETQSKATVYKYIRTHEPGDTISIEFLREGIKDIVEAVLEKADNSLFMDLWKFKSQIPAVAAGSKSSSEIKKRIESEISRLTKEIEKLRLDLENLKDQASY